MEAAAYSIDFPLELKIASAEFNGNSESTMALSKLEVLNSKLDSENIKLVDRLDPRLNDQQLLPKQNCAFFEVQSCLAFNAEQQKNLSFETLSLPRCKIFSAVSNSINIQDFIQKRSDKVVKESSRRIIDTKLIFSD